MPYLRQQLIDAAIRVAQRGLNNGTSGNLSVRAVQDGEAGFAFDVQQAGVDGGG